MAWGNVWVAMSGSLGRRWGSDEGLRGWEESSAAALRQREGGDVRGERLGRRSRARSKETESWRRPIAGGGGRGRRRGEWRKGKRWPKLGLLVGGEGGAR